MYITHSIIREKYGYNITFHFFNTSSYSTHSIFNSYIFVSGRNDSDQKVSDGINNFAIRYPQVSRQTSEGPAYFLLIILIAILFGLKQHRKSITKFLLPFLISYRCITCLSIRSQCDLENPLNYLKVCGKKYDINFILFTIYHSKCKNQAKYFILILLLSGDITLNPGPPHNSQIEGLSWNVFDKKGLQFLHINVNSLLPKIEEIRFIAKKSKATVIGITETKLDGTIFDAKIYIEGCSIVRCDSDRKGECVACYIKHDICFSTKNILSKRIESIFVDLLFRKPSPYL